MQIKNSILLATALTAGSAVARVHGHERRHAHNKAEVAAPATTEGPKVDANVEKRADMVYATIDGVLQSWINNWFGEVSESTSTSSSTSTSIYVAPTPAAESESSSTTTHAVESVVSAVPTPASSSGSNSGSNSGSSSGSDWYTYPKNGDFSTEGFGGYNCKDCDGDNGLGISWTGNTGSPWGSNIIEVPASRASQYRHVIRFEGAEKKPWTVLFFNKKGPTGLMDGFFSPNKAISFTLEPNDVKYVAIDNDSTGGWTAYEGEESILSDFGAYASTWGEFTMRTAPGFTSWDVSCIQAQNANKEIQGMKICEHDDSNCSIITNGMGQVTNAYTSAETKINGIGGNVQKSHIRLLVNLDWA